MTTESTSFSFVSRGFSLWDFIALSSLTISVTNVANSIFKNETFTAIQYAILGISISYFYWIHFLNIQEMNELNKNIEDLEKTGDSLKIIPGQLRQQREKIEEQSSKIQIAIKTVERDGEERRRQEDQLKKGKTELEKSLNKEPPKLAHVLENIRKINEEYKKEIQELKNLLSEKEKEIIIKEKNIKEKERDLDIAKEKLKSLAKRMINRQKKTADHKELNI